MTLPAFETVSFNCPIDSATLFPRIHVKRWAFDVELLYAQNGGDEEHWLKYMEDDSIYAACPIRSQSADFGEKLQHARSCKTCLKINMTILQNKKLTTFRSAQISTNATPNVVSYSKLAARPSEAKAEALETKNPKKEPELKIVESRRTENQQKSVEKPKTVVAPSNMPWVPNPHFLLPNNSISALSLEDHRRYVAIITNFIRMDKVLGFEIKNIELETMDAKLKPERQKFTDYIKKYLSHKGYYCSSFKGAVAFGLERLKKRLCTISDAGYHSIVGEVEWRSNTRSIANRNMYVKKPKMLSLGKSKKLEMPDPSRRCVFERDANVLTERYPCDYTTKTLRDDPQALEFGVENDVTAILSSSAMRHLLTSHFPLRQYRRAFPVSVFRKFINGAPQRVVCIGNHVPITPPSKPDLMKTFAKYIVRNAMEKREKSETSQKRSLPTKEVDEYNDDEWVELQEVEQKEQKEKAPVTSNPYSYMVVPVDNDGTHKVLVRSRPHGRDIANTPISITSKLQYIPQCGAEESFMEEKIWNALTGALKESTYQADIHLNIPETHCLQLTQNRSIKMFEALPEEAKELLSGRWQRFYNLLEEIKQLQDGEYLLVENDDEMLEIWTEASGEAKWTRQIIEEKSLLSKCQPIDNESIEFLSRFNGIAIHTPLIWHIVKSRIPASFLPPNPNKNYVHRGGKRGRSRSRGIKGRGRGGDGRRRGRGESSDRGKPAVYTDLDAVF